jgi:hypothetical protein
MAGVTEAKVVTNEGSAVPTHCEFPGCGKKLPKWRGGKGRPRRYCKGTKCAQRDYARLHPRVTIDKGDLG